MTICLITRTQPGAQVTQALLHSMGHQPDCVPAAIIEPTHAKIDATGVQALLMTSAAAARSIKINPEIRALPVYAVGDATAEAASQAGFANVISAGGDGATLAVLAADRMKTDAGALLHLRGQEIAGDVTVMLNACGFETRFLEVYHTKDHPDFPAKIITLLRKETGLVLFHSPAGARRFVQAIEGNNLELGSWTAGGLSPACLVPVHHKGFSSLFSASQPDEAALMAAISAHWAQSGT